MTMTHTKRKAVFGTPRDVSKALPPDPERMNDSRAEWAQAALLAFCTQTGCDYADALGDLLGNLMHLADRDPELDFEAALQRARDYYADETVAP